MGTLGAAFIFGMLASSIAKAYEKAEFKQMMPKNLKEVFKAALITIERAVTLTACLFMFTAGRVVLGGMAKSAATLFALMNTAWDLVCMKRDCEAIANDNHTSINDKPTRLHKKVNLAVNSALKKEKAMRVSLMNRATEGTLTKSCLSFFSTDLKKTVESKPKIISHKSPP